ncbi:MAG: CinA family protein [Lachnospiraceae bacterium]|nr:CinA family protein [Lachnospiraceae bacterium]MDD6450772.1 CinA family protein [Lachnospiraceae bacterium]MDD6578348.1 CinA family protein [Lachnospiraceae bacterium]
MLFEKELVHILKKRKETVATAESCTGGMIVSSIVSVPGASDILTESFVTYSEETKDEILHLDPSIIEDHGVVSYETAKAMAEGLRKTYGVDLGIASTGVAGPGPDGDIPQGIVYLAVSYRSKTLVRRYHFHGTRNLVRFQASRMALSMAVSIIKEVSICV